MLIPHINLHSPFCWMRIEWVQQANKHGKQNTAHGMLGGGGGYSPLNWVGGCRWGVKTWPCLKPLGAQKIHSVTIFLTKNFHMHTLWKGERGGESFAIERWFKVRWYWYGWTLYSAVYHHTFIKICCVPHALLLVPRSPACHKHCGLGNNPVINGAARQ